MNYLGGEFPDYTLGDVDFDGVIGVQDLLYIADIVSNNSFNTFPTADINQDGEISISDLILLIQQIIGD